MSLHSAIVATDGKGNIDIAQFPTTTPGPGEVLIKVEYAAFIPFDTYITDIGYYVTKFPHVLGHDAAGTVVQVGDGVQHLRVGDRVTAFTYGASSRKGAQQFITEPHTVCAKVPDTLSLHEAVTIPDNFVTAFYTIFNQLEIARPPSFLNAPTPANASVPILVYGAGAIAGQYAVQLLHLAGYKNIIATASPRNHEVLKSFGATHVFDYRSATLEEDVARAVGSDGDNGKVPIVIDGVTSEGTLKIIAKLVSPKGKVALLLPVKEGDSVTVHKDGGKMYLDYPEERNPLPKGTKTIGVRTFLYQNDPWLKEHLLPDVLAELLEAGLIKPSRVRLFDEGSVVDRVKEGLDLLRNNKVSGEKVVVKID